MMPKFAVGELRIVTSQFSYNRHNFGVGEKLLIADDNVFLPGPFFDIDDLDGLKVARITGELVDLQWELVFENTEPA